MKKEIHPISRPVLFHDNSSGEEFLIESTIHTKETKVWKDGKEYPLFYVEISSASHPFYTGERNIVDSAGRVQKFNARREKGEEKKKASKNKTSAQKKDAR
jgi:large subunit ribosomal protein L31